MGLQQSSFDFFSSSPEEKKPEENQLPKTQKPATKPGPEVFPADPISEKIVAPPVPVSTQTFIPDPQVPAFEDNAAQPAEAHPMHMDEQMRNLDFLVKEPSAVAGQVTRKSTRGRMKLSEMDTLVDLVDVPADDILFQKRYYNIGAVSEMFKVNISLIRFWENEFDILKPKKNGKGDRLFRPEDIKNLQLIYHLLREKKYTIDGAKDFLKKNKTAEESFAVIDALKKIRSFLLELKTNL